ncbi:unnamed protein product [Paramecium octaurelia]|uniref:Uncharacterized protein n=1 Tax=Paramecium octaurelia TaxID=43137 RepID=A0A8S1USA9_PAROT|nr:unnamed protein product [Paramecium octaurelia]
MALKNREKGSQRKYSFKKKKSFIQSSKNNDLLKLRFIQLLLNLFLHEHKQKKYFDLIKLLFRMILSLNLKFTKMPLNHKS